MGLNIEMESIQPLRLYGAKSQVWIRRVMKTGEERIDKIFVRYPFVLINRVSLRYFPYFGTQVIWEIRPESEEVMVGFMGVVPTSRISVKYTLIPKMFH